MEVKQLIEEQKIKGSEGMASINTTRSHFGELTTNLVSSKAPPEVQCAAVEKMLEQRRKAVGSTKEIQQQLGSNEQKNLDCKNKETSSQTIVLNEPVVHLKNIPFSSDVLSVRIGNNQTSIEGLQNQTALGLNTTLDKETQTSNPSPYQLR